MGNTLGFKVAYSATSKTSRAGGPKGARRATEGAPAARLALSIQLEVPLVKPRQKDIGQVHRPEAIIELFEPDSLSVKRLGQEHVSTSELDLSPRPDVAHFVVTRVTRLWHRRRIGPQGRVVQLGRHPLPKRLMRPLLVAYVPEAIEELLLCRGIGCRRTRGLLLQIPMHALMAPVLLGMTRLDSLRNDPELDPTHR